MRISATGIIAGAIALVVVAQLQLHWHVAAFLRPPSTASPRHLALDREAGAAGRGRRLRAVVGVQTGFNGPDAQPQYNYQLRREQLRRTWFPNATERIRCASGPPAAAMNSRCALLGVVSAPPSKR